MNHAQARAPLQQAAAMQAVYQFLRENALESTLATMEEESGFPSDESALADKPSHLLTAISFYESQHEAAFAVRAVDPTFQQITKWMATLRESSEQPVSYEWRKLETHPTANVICVKWQPKDGSELYAAGAVDKTVAICDALENAVLRRVSVSGPVLCLHFNPVFPRLLLATCMNGGFSVVDVEEAVAERANLQTEVNHKKFAIVGKWSPDGTHFATGGHDGIVYVYGPAPNASPASAAAASDAAAASSSSSSSSPSSPVSAPLRWVQIGSIEYPANVECLEWVSSEGFYVSVREDNYLHHVAIAQGGHVKEVAKINVNESGDDHVSFSVLDMALSPAAASTSGSPRTLLLATDRHRVILLQLHSSIQVRNFYNLTNDGYSTPRLAWSPCGKFAYVTSQDKSVKALEVASGKTIAQLQGHAINVRDVSVQDKTNRLVSCSFDKTCRVWTPAVE